MHLTYRWERDDADEVEVEIVFLCSAYYPAVLGRSPENCRPAEGGEVEITRVSPASENCTAADAAEFWRLYREGGSLANEVDERCLETALGSYDGPDYY